jgi:hypothetical protein
MLLASNKEIMLVLVVWLILVSTVQYASMGLSSIAKRDRLLHMIVKIGLIRYRHSAVIQKKIIVAEKFVLQVPDGMAFSYEENRSCLDNEII